MKNKINYKRVLFLVLLGWSQFLNPAGSIDGTSSIKYLTTNQVLRNNQYARGFVKLNNGATILNYANFNITKPLSCGLDLRETGTISLQGNLYLDSNFTITSNGVICGNGYAIFMNGDLTISDSTYVRVLHINTNTIIDGCGHSLILGKRAKLFVDDNVTLTLRNMVIKPTFNYCSDPCIKLASNRSKLALENVEFDLVQDFDFVAGQLFVHNDVAITGTSAFVYHSTQHSYLTSGATLYFDLGTTFSVAPATFTDCRFDQSPTYTSNNFIQMTDQTSQLYLNGCSLLSTLTGCRFTSGTINFENKVNLRSIAASDISSTPATLLGSAATGASPYSVNWSPDGRFLAVVSYSSHTLQIFSFTGNGNPLLIGSASTGSGTESISVNWSPDGRFIAVAIINSNLLQIFRFYGSGNPSLVGSVNTGAGAGPTSVNWSPDGRFLAVINCDANSLQIFGFTGSGNPTLIGSVSTGAGTYPQSVNWSPNGRFLAVANYSSNTLQIYGFTGSGNPSLVGSVSSELFAPISVNWSPDGRFIVVANLAGNTLSIFKFTGSGNPSLIGFAATGVSSYSVNWSPSGKFIAIVNFDSNALQIFSFSGNGNPSLIGAVSTGTYPQSVNWSPDGRFLAIVNFGASTLQIFKVNYINSTQTQAMSSGIVFGDSSKGASYDPTVNVLGGAYVETYGNINYDCAN